MKKRAKICLYIFLVCAFFALGIFGYFVLNNGSDQVMVGSKKFTVHNGVKDASSYSIQVYDNDEPTNTGEAVYKVNKTATEENNTNKYEIEVLIEGQKVAEESYLQQILSENKQTNKIDCKIKDYTIIFFNSGVQGEKRNNYVDQTLKNVDRDVFCCVVSCYFDNLFTKDGTYSIVCIPFDGDGNEILGPNGESLAENSTYNYSAYYEEDFLQRENYYYNGTWYDYVIESKEELNNLVWWSILYRQAEERDLSFYVKTSDIYPSNINALVINAINNYPEYDALRDQNVYGVMTEKLGYLTDFNYYLEKDFTLNYKDLQEKDTSADDHYYTSSLDYLQVADENYNVDYVSVDDGVDTRTFEIDNVDNVGVKVYNTEQLFMVVQSGEKPIFTDDESVVFQVYTNALQVLREINDSDSLTDYEKALNIYRYITGHVVYDYVVYAYMDLTNDQTIESFGNYSCFYLEGVFYNFEDLTTHYAVCDGLSKAYSLLCNIEGIECEKVNGEVSGGKHAWNRIHLEDSEYDANGYYYIDTTWGEGSYRQAGQDYQVLTHSYFLFKNISTRKINYPKNLESTNPSSDYNYYQHEEYVVDEGLSTQRTIDCYIESDSELNDILSYAQSNVTIVGDSFVLELKFEENYLRNFASRINLLLNAQSPAQQNNFFVSNGVTSSWEWLETSENDIFLFRIYM